MASKKRLLLSLALAGGLLLSPISSAQAQVVVGAHGSFMDIAGGTWGVGGRIGGVLYESYDFTMAAEGVATFFFPPCDQVECDVVALQANLLFRRQVSSYSEAYGGIGFIWEDFTLSDVEGVGDDQTLSGDDVGMSFIVGTQLGQPGGVRPFLEVRFSIMDVLENQGGAVFGLRVPLG
jgi:hypothetical protein